MTYAEPFSLTLDSNVEVVDEVEATIRDYAGKLGFEEPDQYFIGLAAREILINAIKHGNRFDAAKKVQVRLSGVGGLTIEVIDEGDGFQLESVPDPRAPENLERTSGRGLVMARRIMDEFAVEQIEPRGTRVRMVKHAAGTGSSTKAS